MNRTLLSCTVAAVILVIVAELVLWGMYSATYQKQIEEQQEYISTPAPATATPLPTATEAGMTPVPEDAETPTPAPTGEAPAVDFETLCAKYPAVVGWITSPGTNISYPVAQSKDNDYYLRRGLNGKYLYEGTLFADYRCGEMEYDDVYFVYGHHLKRNPGVMFGPLMGYKKQSYYDAHPTMTYSTRKADYRVELAAAYICAANDDIYQQVNFASPSAKEKLFAAAKKNSTFVSPVEIKADDTVLVLSTCTYEYDNARYVVIGKLVKTGTRNG